MFTQNNGIIEHSFEKGALSISFPTINRQNSWDKCSSPKGLPQPSDYSTIQSDASSKASEPEECSSNANTDFQSQLQSCSAFEEGYCLRGRECEHAHLARQDEILGQRRKRKFLLENYPQIYLGLGSRQRSFLQ